MVPSSGLEITLNTLPLACIQAQMFSYEMESPPVTINMVDLGLYKRSERTDAPIRINQKNNEKKTIVLRVIGSVSNCKNIHTFLYTILVQTIKQREMERIIQKKSDVHYKLFSVLIFSILFVVFLTTGSFLTQAASSTLYVDDDNTDGPWNGTQAFPYQYIQHAIDAAEEGDSIFVRSGLYPENLLIQKNLQIRGESRETTIIDGGHNDHTIHVMGQEYDRLSVTISAFTIRNAGGAGNDNIAVSYGSDGEISDNVITNSEQSEGIQLSDCTNMQITQNSIANNYGSGINLIRTTHCKISKNILMNNQKGIYLYDASSSNRIYENSISQNSQYGIQIQNSYFPSINNVIYLNDFTDNGVDNGQDKSNNKWSLQNQGNYWDDYAGEDNDNDNIGDTPYKIVGANNTDFAPLGYFVESKSQGGANHQPTAYKPIISPQEATYGSTISLSGDGSDSDGYITDYNWRSDIDGELSTLQSFSTTQLSQNTHTVYFKVKDNSGSWSAEKSSTITILPPQNQAPTAHIQSISPNLTEINRLVTFEGYGMDDDGSIVDWKWTSNIDGYLTNKAQFETLSLSSGTHSIHFQVKDDKGIWSTKTTQTLIILDDGENRQPIADAGGPYTGLINEPVFFDGSKSSDPDGSIQNYFWNFYNGESGSGRSSQTTYTSSGNYTVTLTVTDDSEATDTATTYVLITEKNQEIPIEEGFPELPIELTPTLIFLFILMGIGVSIILFFIIIKRRE